MSWTHKYSMSLPATPKDVFRALTDPGALTQWFAEQVDISLKPGGNYRFWGKHTLGAPTKQDARQTLTQLEPGRMLGFSWRLYNVDTEAVLTVVPAKDGARLTVEHHVAGDLGLQRQKELIDDHWRMAFGNLYSHLIDGTGILLPDYTDPTPEVRLTLIINASPEKVFRALLEPEALNRWFGAQSAIVEPLVGGRYVLGWRYRVDGKDVDGGPTRILELVPNRKLVLDWPDWRGDTSVTGQTITFSLEPQGDATRLTFVHAGFGRMTDVGDYGLGWQQFLAGLRTEVEQ